ncbi:MAG: AAA family ATPase [Candidatus Thiodiazotropha taylori]
MINELTIRNYRSIRDDKITLQPLTVLIGANGSGKSNLVKALEFLSEIPALGVRLAVSRQGGRNGMVSKEIPLNKIRNSPTFISYRVCLPPPVPGPDTPESVDVEHSFELQFTNSRSFTITQEKLQFHKVLYVGHVLSEDENSKQVEPDSPLHYSSDSSFTIHHTNNKITYNVIPEFSNDNIHTYLSWLGLESLSEKISSPDELTNFVNTIRTSFNKPKKKNNKNIKKSELFLDPHIKTIADFSAHAQRFLDSVKAIKRYDLLLHELRREQDPSDSQELSKTGQNLPSALRIIKAENKESFRRLQTTFETIAPHISNMKPQSLRTGKEFIEFVESKSGREIESWESSDGSLRALAILIALETTSLGETVIIEEPEQNLHPWAIRSLIDHIRVIVEEKNIQVILTTHSEHVLERINKQEVRVVTREPENGTSFKRLDQIISKSNIEMGEIGRLWVKGMLGGVPSL